MENQHKKQGFHQSFLKLLKNFLQSIKNFFLYFQEGDIYTKLSYLFMGAGCLGRKQIVKGLAFLGLQASFLFFFVYRGIYYMSMLSTLGTKKQGRVWDEAAQIYRVQQGHNSMLLLLFGVISAFLLLVFFLLYLKNIQVAYENQKKVEQGKALPTFKEECTALMNENYHITVLSIPVLLTFAFTILPLIFMILMAFTNFDKTHQPPGNLFTWVGLENFTKVLYQNPMWKTTFFKLLGWTIVWAIFATVLNYVFGVLLAIMINKVGIKLKKMWRTFFVMTIAIPQFVSLLLMSKLLADNGGLNNFLLQLGWIQRFIPFLSSGDVAKVTIILVNLWVGIPYTMLITSGILMNIPRDLYEASYIDGASPMKQFIKITLPYMLHVTTPYLITQFVGNINNFNVIYLLTGGGPKSLNLYQAGETDLLVTWLYKLTLEEQNYALASTIGIIIFVLLASFSLISYNLTSSASKEDTFS